MHILHSLLLFLCFSFIHSAHAQNVRVSNFDAFNFGVWVSGGFTADDSTCVFRDDGNPRYRVTATDNSTLTPNEFRLENIPRTVEIPYEVRWRSTTANGGARLTHGVPRNRGRATDVDELCAVGGLTSNLRIRIRRADLQAAPAGNYSAEVRFLIEPR